MKNMSRVIAIAMLGLAVSPLTVQTQLGSQGPPSDRPAQGAGMSTVGESRIQVLLVNGALSLLAILSLAPLAWMVSVSFMAAGEANHFPPPLLPDAPHLDAYRALFGRMGMARYFANSALVAREWSQWLAVPAGRIRTIENGVDTAAFHPPSAVERAEARRRFGVEGDAPVVAFVGDGGFPEVDFQRGPCTFCEACREACPSGAIAARSAAPIGSVS